MVTFSCFRMATFRPARQNYDKQEAKRRRMKSVVLSRGGAKGRHAKTRKSDHLAGVAWRLFVHKTQSYDMSQISHHSFRFMFVVSLPGGAKGRHAKTRQNHHFSPRKHAYTTWHKTATLARTQRDQSKLQCTLTQSRGCAHMFGMILVHFVIYR